MERYETLRAAVLAQRPGAYQQGLALLMREGMARWSSAWASCAPSAPPAGSASSASLQAPPETPGASALVQLLASMALSTLGRDSP